MWMPAIFAPPACHFFTLSLFHVAEFGEHSTLKVSGMGLGRYIPALLPM